MPFSPALVYARESDSVDRKVDASSPEKIVHEIGAFANTHGGHVIVGVADDGEVVGVGDFQKAEAAIVQSVVSRTDPQLVPTILSYLHASGKELLIVEVNYFEGAEPLKIRVKDAWKVYERVGSVSLVVDDDRLEQMRRERRGTDTLDQAGAAVGMDALDQALIAEMFASVGLAVDEALLQSSEVARTINGKLTPSNAGLLLFGFAPQTVFQDAYMRCGRYSGTSKTHRTADRDLTQQPLLRVIDGAERFLAEHTGEIDVGSQGNAAAFHPALQPRRGARVARQRDRPRRLQPAGGVLAADLQRPVGADEPGPVPLRHHRGAGPQRRQPTAEPGDRHGAATAALRRAVRSSLGQGPASQRRARVSAASLAGGRAQRAGDRPRSPGGARTHRRGGRVGGCWRSAHRAGPSADAEGAERASCADPLGAGGRGEDRRHCGVGDRRVGAAGSSSAHADERQRAGLSRRRRER